MVESLVATKFATSFKDVPSIITSRSKSLEHDATKTEIPEMTTENVSQNAAQGTIENEYVAELQIAGNAPLGVFSDAQAESEVNQSQNMTGEQPGTPLLLNILDALTMSGAEVLTESIERIGNAEDIPLIEKHLHSRSPGIRESARFAIERIKLGGN